jgi:hypothetical protein
MHYMANTTVPNSYHPAGLNYAIGGMVLSKSKEWWDPNP